MQPQISMLHNTVLERIRKLRRHRIISRTDKFVAKIKVATTNEPVGILKCWKDWEIFISGVDVLA